MSRMIALSLLLVPLLGAGPHGQAPRPPTRSVSTDWALPGPVVPLPAPAARALDGIGVPSLAAHIGLLASPALEGRGLGSRGLDAAAEYVAASLSLAGVPPAGRPAAPPGGADVTSAYFDAVPLREIRHPAGQLLIEVTAGDGVGRRTFVSGVDCLFPEVPPAEIEGPVVFAGYGIRETTPARDDYRGLDVRNRIVAVLAGAPPGEAWQAKDVAARWAAAGGRARYAAKVELAASLGARAIIAIEPDAFAGIVASADQMPAPVYFAPFEVAGPDPVLPPVVRVSPRVGQAITGQADPTAAIGGAVPAPVVRATLRVTGDERVVVSRNVVAVLQGSDPALRDEAIVLGTHMDHLGIVAGATYPGADDNASGVAALLEIAKAFAASPRRPRRTLVFAFWTGEEEGKLGSGYYVRHPIWPLDRTYAYLNLDMIGHPWTGAELAQLVAGAGLANEKAGEALTRMDPADFVELGVAEWAPELGPMLLEAARGTGLALHLDWTDGKNGGSDYRDFARREMRWVRFFGNYFPAYHKAGDTARALDAGQVLKMTRLAFASAWLLADR